MKKLSLFLILALLLSSGLYAQIFQSLGTNLYYTVNPSVGCFPCVTEYQKLEYIGDTLINGLTCQVIEKSGTLTPCSDNESSHEYLFQDGSEVYWYNTSAGEFSILYDFGAIAGDMWQVIVDDCLVDVFVDSVTHLDYNGDLLKTLHVSDVEGFFSGKIIENIGHTTSFFPRDVYWYCNYGSLCDDKFINGLRCYANSEHLYNFTGMPCDTTYITGRKEVLYQPQGIKIYPNPADKYIVIENTIGLKEATFRIYNMLGNLVSTTKIDHSLQVVEFNCQPGIYFYSAETPQSIITGKLTVR